MSKVLESDTVCDPMSSVTLAGTEGEGSGDGPPVTDGTVLCQWCVVLPLLLVCRHWSAEFAVSSVTSCASSGPTLGVRRGPGRSGSPEERQRHAVLCLRRLS